jgi:hypothetical protein
LYWRKPAEVKKREPMKKVIESARAPTPLA